MWIKQFVRLCQQGFGLLHFDGYTTSQSLFLTYFGLVLRHRITEFQGRLFQQIDLPRFTLMQELLVMHGDLLLLNFLMMFMNFLVFYGLGKDYPRLLISINIGLLMFFQMVSMFSQKLQLFTLQKRQVPLQTLQCLLYYQFHMMVLLGYLYSLLLNYLINIFIFLVGFDYYSMSISIIATH